MEMCSGYRARNEHEEIVIEGRACPLCDALRKIDELEREVTSLQRTVDDPKNSE